jgi:hypothetical protein
MTVKQHVWFYKNVATAEFDPSSGQVRLPMSGKFSNTTFFYKYCMTKQLITDRQRKYKQQRY